MYLAVLSLYKKRLLWYYDITFIMKIMFVNHILLCQSMLFYSNEKKKHEFFNFLEDRNHS